MRRHHVAAVGMGAAVAPSPAYALSVFDAAGPAADVIGGLGRFVLITAVVVSIVVLTLVVVGAVRRRGTLDEHAPYDAGGGKSWILIGGFAAPSLILGAVFVATMSTLAAFPLAADEEDPLLRVIGHQWWWEVAYERGDPNQHFTTANEIHVPAGRTVEVALESADVIHSFWVPALHGKVDLVPGKTNTIRFRADEPGVYLGKCAEFCGVQHTNMGFRVVAHPPEAFAAWLERQRAPAAEPDDDRERRGRQLFASHACAFCHTIRGVSPGGSVAPDLTHLASRATIAAGALRNTRANLTAWVVDAPQLKPGTRMPAMPEFTGEELQALVSYLESLD